MPSILFVNTENIKLFLWIKLAFQTKTINQATGIKRLSIDLDLMFHNPPLVTITLSHNIMSHVDRLRVDIYSFIQIKNSVNILKNKDRKII